jgi:general secretion pathway protein G
MNRPFPFRKKRSGFTLIELMIVILIIAVLAAMIIPKLMTRVDDAKAAKAMSDLQNFNTLLEVFRNDCDRYPTTEEGLDALRNPPNDANGWRGPYLSKQIPLDPWGNPYTYEWPGSYGDDSFTLLSYGADNAPEGEGKNADIYATD